MCCSCFFFQAEDGIRDLVRSRGLGDVYKRQDVMRLEGYAASLAGDTKNAAMLLEKILNERPSEELSLIHI